MVENETEKTEQTPNDANERNEPKTTKLIDDANLAAKRIEEANKERKALLDREEELMAKKALGGKSEAGASDIKPKPMSETDYAKGVMAGSINPFEEQ